MVGGMDSTKRSDPEFELVRNTSVPADASKGDIETARLRDGQELSAAIASSPWQASQRKAIASESMDST